MIFIIYLQQRHTVLHGRYFKLIVFAARLLDPNVINKMLRLLAGINIAAIIGDKLPCTAKKIPARLYMMEMTKLAITTFLFTRHSFINLCSSGSLSACIMASLAGVKLLECSLTAIPLSACFK